jgi:hypothetical protein
LSRLWLWLWRRRGGVGGWIGYGLSNQVAYRIGL